MAAEAGRDLIDARYDTAERSRVGVSSHWQTNWPQRIEGMQAGS